MEAFAILRVEKINQSTETAAHNHNLRASKTKLEANVDYSKSHLNKVLLGERNTIATINAKVEQRTNKKKLRDDANRVVEFMLSASPEHFYDFEKCKMTREEWDYLKPSNFKDNMQAYWSRVNEVKATLKPEETKKWLEDSKEWMKKEFDSNIVNAVVHFDEKTPHIHMLCTPIINGKLTAKDFFTPNNARKWQTSYAKATGLKRGEVSEKKNEALKDAEIKKAKAEARQEGFAEGKEDLKDWQQDQDKRYKEHYKARYEKKGYQAGLAKAEQDAKAKFSFVDGFKGAWHSPSQKAQEEAKKQVLEARKMQERADEEVRKAKVQADNRVIAVAQQLQAEQAKNRALEKELLDKEQKIKELTPTAHRQEQKQKMTIK